MDAHSGGKSPFDQGYKLRQAELKELPVHSYFWDLGDAIEERVKDCLREAENLRNDGYPGASLTRSVTAIELTIRLFLLTPLVGAAFLSDEWADILMDEILHARKRGRDRNLVPEVLRQWGMEVTDLETSDGSQLWERIQSLVKQRNAYVHEGQDVDGESATEGLDCTRRLLTEAVFPIAAKVGVKRVEWGRWERPL